MAVTPGGHVTPHQGKEIDEAILKGLLLRVVNNGFIKLDSSQSIPVNLNKLKTSGNYTMSYWDYGPLVKSFTKISPLNLTVSLIGNELYQFAKLGPYTFSRKYDAEMEAFEPWFIDQTAGAINPGPTAPPNPVINKTLWLDMSIPAKPSLKVYVNNEWVELIPATAMLASVYDPNGKQQDIYAYIDEAVKTLTDTGFTGEDIKTHIENTEIHATPEEKAKWDAAASMNNLDDAMAELRENVDSAIKNEVSADLTAITKLMADFATLQGDIDDHMADDSIHPSSEKQAEWDSKADGDHTHILDGTVVVDTDHIDGALPESLAPYRTKERVYQVSSIAEMLTLTAPVHDGDVVCMSGDSFEVHDAEFGISAEDDAILVFDDEDQTPIVLQILNPTVATIWYFVIDDKKLNSLEGYLRFSSGNASFDDLQDKPNTLGGYGITDATPKSEFDKYNAKLKDLGTVKTMDLQVLQKKYNRLMANRAVIDLVATDGGVPVDTGAGGSILRFEMTVQNSKTLNLTNEIIPKVMLHEFIAWTTDNESVATVDDSGVVSGVAAGTCVITGYCEDYGFYVEVEITVGDAVYTTWAVDTKGNYLVDSDEVPIAFEERSV